MNPRQTVRGSHIVIVALCETDGTLTRVRVESRDYQYRLVTRAEFVPLSMGGPEIVLAQAVELWLELVADSRLPNTPALSRQDRLDLEADH